MSVVDLGAAPGSWSQVLRERLGPKARIVAIDLLPMDPVRGVTFVQGDFATTTACAARERARRTQGRPCRFRPGPQSLGHRVGGPGAGGASWRAGARICRGSGCNPAAISSSRCFRAAGSTEFERATRQQLREGLRTQAQGVPRPQPRGLSGGKGLASSTARQSESTGHFGSFVGLRRIPQGNWPPRWRKAKIAVRRHPDDAGPKRRR